MKPKEKISKNWLNSNFNMNFYSNKRLAIIHITSYIQKKKNRNSSRLGVIGERKSKQLSFIRNRVKYCIQIVKNKGKIDGG